MKIELDKVILVSNALAVIITLAFVFQFVSFPDSTEQVPIVTQTFLVSILLFFIFGNIAFWGAIYDIFTAKNGGRWKLGWTAVSLFLYYFGIFAYLFIGRKSRQ